MLGPVNDFDSNLVHCSSLMTRPKDLDNRRVILALSYQKGLSVNDHVDKSSFDDNQFLLKLTSIDNIISDILNIETQSFQGGCGTCLQESTC